MKARLAASVLAVGLVVGLTGCGMVTPVATNIHYDASDGTNLTSGDIAIRNLMIITSHTEYGTDTGSLVFTVINSGSENRTVTFQYGEGSAKENVSVEVPASSTLALGIGETQPIELKNINTPAGGTLEMYVQSGMDEGRVANVPVLDTTLEEYQNLAR